MLQTQRLVPLCAALAASGHGLLGQLRGMSQLALQNTGAKMGPGGRSSVNGVTATVFGCTGFLGRYIVNALATSGSQVVCPFRSVEEKAMTLKQMGDLGQVVLLRDFDIRDEEFIRYAVSRSNVVVNLIGTRRETHNFSFDDVHVQWPTRLAKILAESPHLERVFHFTDLGASPDHASARLRGRAAGDAALQAALPNATVFKLAPVVGDEDDFFNNYLIACKYGVAVPLVEGGTAELQPVYVPDVVDAFKAALARGDSAGQTYYLGGPEVLTERQIVDLIYDTLHEDEKAVVPYPAWFAKLLWRSTDILNRRLPDMFGNHMRTADWVDTLSRPLVVPEGVKTIADLGVVPHKVTEGLAIEPIRFCRVGGYALGDTAAISKSLPVHVKKFYGMDTFEKNVY